MKRRNRRRLHAVRTLADEQLAQQLALKLHLSLAQMLGLIARFGIDSARLPAAARKLAA